MSGKKTASSQKLAFVLGGGGARGALQVGALRALLAAGIMPDMMIGTSIGAVNATFLTVHGLTLAGLDTLERAWGRAAQADLLPGSYLWLTTRVFFNRAGIHPYHHRLRSFFIEQGISPEMTFADVSGPRLFQVATDLNRFTVRLYGVHPQQKVLDGLLASTAIPPWVRPLEMDGTLLMDGGALSNLPIESAIRLGATEIIALDLFDPRPAASPDMGFGPFVSKLLASVENRQIEMELAYAEARGVPVTHVALRAEQPIVLWDFSRYQELIVRGYALMEEMLADYRPAPPVRPWYQRLLSGLRK